MPVGRLVGGRYKQPSEKEQHSHIQRPARQKNTAQNLIDFPQQLSLQQSGTSSHSATGLKMHWEAHSTEKLSNHGSFVCTAKEMGYSQDNIGNLHI